VSERPKTTTRFGVGGNVSKTPKVIELDSRNKNILNKSLEYNDILTSKKDIVKRLKENLNSKGFVDFPLKSDKNKLTQSFISKSQSKDSENNLKDTAMNEV